MAYSGWTEVYPSYGGIPRGYRVTLLWHERVEKDRNRDRVSRTQVKKRDIK